MSLSELIIIIGDANVSFLFRLHFGVSFCHSHSYYVTQHSKIVTITFTRCCSKRVYTRCKFCKRPLARYADLQRLPEEKPEMPPRLKQTSSHSVALLKMWCFYQTTHKLFKQYQLNRYTIWKGYWRIFCNNQMATLSLLWRHKARPSQVSVYFQDKEQIAQFRHRLLRKLYRRRRRA